MSLCEQHQRFPQGTLSHGSDFCGILQLLCCSKPDPTPAFLAGMIHRGISGERSQQQLPVRKQPLRDISSRDPAKAVFSHTEQEKNAGKFEEDKKIQRFFLQHFVLAARNPKAMASSNIHQRICFSCVCPDLWKLLMVWFLQYSVEK